MNSCLQRNPISVGKVSTILALKIIVNFCKTDVSIFLKFQMENDQIAWKLLLQVTKHNNVNFSPEPLCISWKYAGNVNGALVLELSKWKKIGCWIRPRWPTFSVLVPSLFSCRNLKKCWADFCQIYSNWSFDFFFFFFIFMRMVHPRRLLTAITENRKIGKEIISQYLKNP